MKYLLRGDRFTTFSKYLSEKKEGNYGGIRNPLKSGNAELSSIYS